MNENKMTEVAAIFGKSLYERFEFVDKDSNVHEAMFDDKTALTCAFKNELGEIVYWIPNSLYLFDLLTGEAKIL